jgi:hypothetical protein
MRNRLPNSLIAVLLAALIALSAIPGQAQSDLLRVLSPAPRTVVSPGQAVTVSVAADASVEKLAVVGQAPLGVARVVSTGPARILARGEGESAPQQFQIVIPADTVPGTYRVSALGRTTSGELRSEPVTIDVENAQNPARIWAEPSLIQFTKVGDRIPLRVVGQHTDGARQELTRSLRTAYSSANPRIATVDEHGVVTARSAGQTSIVVRTPSADYSLSVRVPGE